MINHNIIINKFNKTIPIFDNNVVINHNKIAANNFTIHANNVYNCKNMYLMFIKDGSIVKIPNKSCYVYLSFAESYQQYFAFTGLELLGIVSLLIACSTFPF